MSEACSLTAATKASASATPRQPCDRNSAAGRRIRDHVGAVGRAGLGEMSDEPVLVGAPTQTACRAAVVMAASVLPAGTSLRLMARTRTFRTRAT